jgi:hypothetical protein
MDAELILAKVEGVMNLLETAESPEKFHNCRGAILSILRDIQWQIELENSTIIKVPDAY